MAAKSAVAKAAAIPAAAVKKTLIKKTLVAAKKPAAKRGKYEPAPDDSDEIDSDEVNSDDAQSDGAQSDDPEETDEEGGDSKYGRGYNRYGTEDPILAAAEEALDNGLFDSEGNMDEEGFEGYFGQKFATGADDDDLGGGSGDGLSDDFGEDASDDLSDLPSADTDVSDAPSADADLDAAESGAGTARLRREQAAEPVHPDARAAIEKQIKGLLNRLSLGNFESIAGSIEAVYGAHARRDCTEVVTDLVLAAVTAQANLLDSFVLVFAALVATLSHLVGVEFAAHLLQRIVETLEANRGGSAAGAVPAERVVMNLVVFLSFLYDLQIVSYRIVGDLIAEAVTRLGELDVEVVLKLVRNCGAQFRRDDPAALKQIVVALGERAAQVSREQQTSRFRFMLEAIADLKNNKQRSAALQQGDLETVKKLLRNMAQQRAIAKFEPLRIGLDDLRQADTRGKWWLVGGAWAQPEKAQARPRAEAARDSGIAALAREQRMNTDVRKAIFGALVSSDDYLDAVQRLLGLRLTAKQERDIVVVVLHCCAQEKAYNPFYSLVALQFARLRHNHVVTLKYAFWDWIHERLEEDSLRRISHYAQMLAFLIGHQALPLSVVKKADFLHLSDKASLFFQILFGKLLTEAPADSLPAIFEGLSLRKPAPQRGEDADQDERAACSEGAVALKAAIDLFLAFHLRPRTPAELPFVKDHSLLTRRIDQLRPYLK